MRPIAALIATAMSLCAAVTEVHIVDRTDVLAGAAFGPAGPYERIVAKAWFAVDPKNPSNRIITDIDLAPKNSNGAVEFSADIVVIKPRDSAKANGAVLLEIPNRGGIGMLRTFNAVSAQGDEYGDRYLLEQGYTLVLVGWQFDVPQDRPLKVYVPAARGAEGPIRGLVRSEFVPSQRTTAMDLADRSHVPYQPVDRNDPAARLTVRSSPSSAPVMIPRSAWAFTANGAITMNAGFEPGKVYELVYTAQDPPLAGLGPAAVRDFISFLKYGGGSATSVLSDQRRFIKRAIGFGTSQSGRFLRTFLYYGFNSDEKNRKVFDGVWAHVAGAGRGSFNIRFAQPSRDGHPLMNLYYPTDLFPFTDLPETDPDTGETGGLLDRTTGETAPRIFYTNGSYEYWGRASSLIHTTPDAKQDAPLAPSTRIYFLAGTQHGANARPVRNGTQQLANPSDYRWTMRALLAAFNSWLAAGTEPPPSQYPRISRDELAPFEAIPFPTPAGVSTPRSMYHAMRLDFGPEFATRGIVTNEPPKLGKPFPQLVPRVDINDGNETSGIRSVDLRVPVGTYWGWNLRSPAVGAADALADMIGSFIPYARTRAEREKTRDRRPSIEERYANRDEYLAKVKRAAADLAGERFLLERDIEAVVRQAAERWDLVMNRP